MKDQKIRQEIEEDTWHQPQASISMHVCVHIHMQLHTLVRTHTEKREREREADSGRCGFFQTHHFKVEVGTSELACRVKALAVKSDVLSSIPGTYTVEGRNQLSIVVL